MLSIEPRNLGMLGKHFTTRLYPQLTIEALTVAKYTSYKDSTISLLRGPLFCAESWLRVFIHAQFLVALW
jgi:hypothetical protein